MPESSRAQSEAAGAAGTGDRSDAETVLATLKHLVQPLASLLPADTEVVLHDLRLLPHSIIAIAGNVTGRSVGDPATDLLLESAYGDVPDHRMAYSTRLEDGRQLQSSTVIFRDSSNRRVAALCINADNSRWQAAYDLLGSLPFLMGRNQPPKQEALAVPDVMDPVSAPHTETFVHSVDQLATLLITSAVEKAGVPVELMKKKHKLQVVEELQGRGMFTLRDAVDQVAAALDVSRFTIYNYLNEISEVPEI